MKSPHSTRISALFGVIGALLAATTASGQPRDEYGEINQTVARVSYLAGDVSLSRGDTPGDWQPADVNVPVTLGDRVYTGSRSRLELQVHGGQFIRLGARTDLAALNLTEDTKQFSLNSGVASFQIRRLSPDEIFEVDTPTAAVTFEQPGEYRVDVDSDGNTRVAVRRGRAMVAAGGGQVPVRAGVAMEISGFDRPRYNWISRPILDSWDRWVEERQNRLVRSASYQYVNEEIVGVDDLDQYGRWDNLPDYGRAWSPASVSVDWAPYRAGRWMWQDPWGWTWVSSEPWGWAPYHYGRWTRYSNRWYWVPVTQRAYYSPALVGFVGSGSGWSASISIGGGRISGGIGGGGYVGWFPLAPREPFSPWWGRRSGVGTTNYSNYGSVRFANRPYVTVVNQNTFAGGGLVTNSFVRDRDVVRQIEAAQVSRGTIPIVPTAQSLHVAPRAGVRMAERPPVAVEQRAVVSRVAPPPAPPTFQEKLQVIRENRGAPVEPAAAERISVEAHGRGRPVTAIRPVVENQGQVTLSPRDSAGAGAAGEPRPQVVVPMRGRPMATAEQPTAPHQAREVAPAQPPAAAPAQREQKVEPPPVERQRPQTEERRIQREAPPQAPAPTEAPPPVQPAPMERRRVRPAEAQAPPPTEVPPVQSVPVERRRARPPEAQAPPPQSPPTQQQPPPTAAPPPPEARPERGRVAPPPQAQPPPPAEAPPPEVKRGRPEQEQPPATEEEKKKKAEEEKKKKKTDEEKKKEERGRKPD